MKHQSKTPPKAPPSSSIPYDASAAGPFHVFAQAMDQFFSQYPKLEASIREPVENAFRNALRSAETEPAIAPAPPRLSEALATFTKDDLLLLADVWGFAVKRNLRKSDLVSYLTEQMLASGVLERYFLTLSDEEVSCLETAIKEGRHKIEEEDERSFMELIAHAVFIEKDFDLCYVPLEIQQAYAKTAGNPGFTARRQKLHWLLECLEAASNCYAVFPIRILQKMLAQKPGNQIYEDELLEEIAILPHTAGNFTCEDGFLYAELCAGDLLDEMTASWKEKPDFYYLPTIEEIEASQEAPFMITNEDALNNFAHAIYDQVGDEQMDDVFLSMLSCFDLGIPEEKDFAALARNLLEDLGLSPLAVNRILEESRELRPFVRGDFLHGFTLEEIAAMQEEPDGAKPSRKPKATEQNGIGENVVSLSAFAKKRGKDN